MEILRNFTQQVTDDLRSLYSRYGYCQYAMSKFEEYDLYARNKDFLISDGVITFTDGGKLMALKPDVTLSIVKNTTPQTGVQKLYYSENVYRPGKGAQGFRELMQVGLECLGQIDDYVISEVLMLAAESLRRISGEAILDISHLGLLSVLMDSMGVGDSGKKQLLGCIAEKNVHELDAACTTLGLSETDRDTLKALVGIRGTLGQALPQVKQLLSGQATQPMLEQMERIASALAPWEDMLRLDFSVVDDLHYYNGIVFKGFVRGVPASVLSGGQYDKLMRKMKRPDGAIGFAVYMDMLQSLQPPVDCPDVDVLLIYSREDPARVCQAAAELTGQGLSVMVQRQIPANLRYGRLIEV